MAENDLIKINSTYMHTNPWFKTREDTVRRADGSETDFYVVECPTGAFIVPVTDDGKIVLVQLFRYRTQRGGWEVPAGSVDDDEDFEAAARRELQEETGYIAGEVQELTPSFDSMNGVCDGVGHVFLATALQQTGDDEKAEEGITNVQAFTKEQIMDMIASGEIVDGLSIAALFKYFITTK